MNKVIQVVRGRVFFIKTIYYTVSYVFLSELICHMNILDILLLKTVCRKFICAVINGRKLIGRANSTKNDAGKVAGADPGDGTERRRSGARCRDPAPRGLPVPCPPHTRNRPGRTLPQTVPFSRPSVRRHAHTHRERDRWGP